MKSASLNGKCPGRRWLKADFVVERISDTVAWIAIYTSLLQCLCGRKGLSVLTTEMESAVPRVSVLPVNNLLPSIALYWPENAIGRLWVMRNVVSSRRHPRAEGSAGSSPLR
jgi:hypothetical protein